MIKKTKRFPKWDRVNQNPIGIHLIAEFWNGRVIENSKKIEQILVQAVKEAKSTPLEVVIHKFSPQGITGVILLAESHIALHSWPEYNYLAVDIFTCGEKSMPQKALEYLKEVFQPERVEVREIKRGILEKGPKILSLFRNLNLLNGRKKVKETLQ